VSRSNEIPRAPMPPGGQLSAATTPLSHPARLTGMAPLTGTGLVEINGIMYMAVFKDSGKLSIAWKPNGSLIAEHSDLDTPCIILLPPQELLDGMVAEIRRQSKGGLEINPG